MIITEGNFLTRRSLVQLRRRLWDEILTTGLAHVPRGFPKNIAQVQGRTEDRNKA